MFVHQLLVACREYHSTAVREERLGMRQQKQHTTLLTNRPTPLAVCVLKSQENKLLGHETVDTVTSQDHTMQRTKISHVHSSALSTPEEPRQLPKNLIRVFDQVAETKAVAVELKEKEGPFEELAPIQLCEESLYSPITEDSSDITVGKLESKQSPAANFTPASAPRRQHQSDLVQLAQDTKDASNRMQKLELRLEHTQMHLNNLETTSKAHMMLLEGRILALEQCHHKNIKFQSSVQTLESGFLPPIYSTDIDSNPINNVYTQKHQHKISWNNSPARKTCLNPLFSELNEIPRAGGTFPAVPTTSHMHPIDEGLPRELIKTCGDQVDRVKRAEIDCFSGIGEVTHGLEGYSHEKGGENVFVGSGSDGSGGGSSDTPEKAHANSSQYSKKRPELVPLNSHDVLLSLRACLNEAQIVLDQARTTLQLS
jgi:hypothetical protein